MQLSLHTHNKWKLNSVDTSFLDEEAQKGSLFQAEFVNAH